MTAQHFDLFGSVKTEAGTGRPIVDFAEATKEGAYVRFFETAFEWEQIDFILYPYFWADPAATWQKRLSMSFDDPQTEAFMRAGFAELRYRCGGGSTMRSGCSLQKGRLPSSATEPRRQLAILTTYPM